MKIKRKEQNKSTGQSKRRDSISFRCPKSGILCVIDEPTEKQIKKVRNGKYTAYNLFDPE